jgi:hypothetical protein
MTVTREVAVIVLGRIHIKSWRTFLPPFLLGICLLAVYRRTLAPGLTWANSGSDGGDLIAAAATGGIPHPTGYPLYLLIARLFQFLPVGSLAFRTNLMSAVFTTAAAILVYAIVSRQLADVQAVHRVLAGWTAGICFGLSPLVWSQAVITEVYALQAFLVVLILYLYTVPSGGYPGQKSLDGYRGLTLGLALGNHMTTLLLVPLALLVGAVRPSEGRQGKFRLTLPSLGRQLVGLLLGLCIYLVLPLHALGHPPVNWGNPAYLDGFLWLVSARLYQSYYLQFQLPGLLEQVRTWAQFTVLQFGLFGIVLGLLGLVVFGKISRLFVLTAGMAIPALAFTLVYHSADAEVYLLPLLVSFSIWIGIGVGRLVEVLFRYSPALAAGTGLLILGLVLFRSLTFYPEVDASRDTSAEDFGREVLSRAPRDAILFAEGDRAVFALWYFHYALRERPDLAVVARELVPFDWYQEGLRSTYPTLSVPGPVVYPETIASANPERPVCQVQYNDRVEMECTTK